MLDTQWLNGVSDVQMTFGYLQGPYACRGLRARASLSLARSGGYRRRDGRRYFIFSFASPLVRIGSKTDQSTTWLSAFSGSPNSSSLLKLVPKIKETGLEHRLFSRFVVAALEWWNK